MTQTRKIHCCGCDKVVRARLTDGRETYPHRSDLHSLPFWKCDTCGNFVGCHHKTDNPTRPLGCIPTPELKNARQHIHKRLDPIWQKGLTTRSKAYRGLASLLGIDQYHTADIRTIEEARDVYRAVLELEEGLS